MNSIQCLVTVVAVWNFLFGDYRDAGQAILEAAILVQKSGIEVNPEIMVPLVGFPKELEIQVDVIHETAKKVFAAKGEKVKYMVGTMIEIPRAALVADEIAKTAQFFSSEQMILPRPLWV